MTVTPFENLPGVPNETTIPNHSIGSMERTLGQLSPPWAFVATVARYLRDSSISVYTPQLWLRSIKGGRPASEVLHTLHRPAPIDVDAMDHPDSRNSIGLGEDAIQLLSQLEDKDLASNTYNEPTEPTVLHQEEAALQAQLESLETAKREAEASLKSSLVQSEQHTPRHLAEIGALKKQWWHQSVSLLLVNAPHEL